jgi:hypothetical protein
MFRECPWPFAAVHATSDRTRLNFQARVSLSGQPVNLAPSLVLCRGRRLGKPPSGLDPIARPLFGIGVPRNVGDYRRAVRSGLKHIRDPRERDPADADKRYVADFLLPFRYARQTLRREGHGFQDRRVDRPERDIIRACIERAEKLGFVMRGDAEFYPRAADRTKVRRREIRSHQIAISCNTRSPSWRLVEIRKHVDITGTGKRRTRSRRLGGPIVVGSQPIILPSLRRERERVRSQIKSDVKEINYCRQWWKVKRP